MTIAPDGQILVPAKEAARLLGVPYNTLRDVCFRGELPVRKVGRRWYFRQVDLRRWVDAGTERLA